MPRSRSYRDDLLKALTDPVEASEYLNAALEDGNLEVFLLALRDVVDANKGITQLAQETALNRESLYKTLSEKGNPELAGIQKILDSLGYRLAIQAK